MMLCIFITFFMIANGLTSADENCSGNLTSLCIQDDSPVFFPRSKEDLKNLCDRLIDAFECGIDYEERCHTTPEFLPRAYSILPTFYELCNPDTLLHEAVVENLECFDDNVIKAESEECYDEPLEETLEKQVEELSKEGLKALKDDNEDEDPYTCLRIMNGVACRALMTEKHCGTVAMDALVDIVRKLAHPLFDECDEKVVQMLPSVIRLRKLENEIENVLERRKK